MLAYPESTTLEHAVPVIDNPLKFHGGTLRLAFRNLARNKRRNLATASAIGLGFAALLALGGFYHSMDGFLSAYTVYATRVGHLTIYKEGGFDHFWAEPKTYSLSPNDQAAIAGTLGELRQVELSGGQLIATGLIGNGCRTLPFVATGISPDIDASLREHRSITAWAEHANQFTKGKGLKGFPLELAPVALAQGLARRLSKPLVHGESGGLGNAIKVPDCQSPTVKQDIMADSNVQLLARTWGGSMAVIDGEVVGHYDTGIKETQKSGMIVPLEMLQRLFDTGNVTYWSVWLKNPDKLRETQHAVEASLAKKGLKVEIYPWTSKLANPLYAGSMNFVFVMIVFLMGVLVAIVVLSIFNSSTMTVIERAQEIGMMRSLGFTRSLISRLFAAEMLFLALGAILAGGLVGILGILAVNHSGIRLYPPGIGGGMQLTLTPGASIIASAAALVVSIAMVTAIGVVRKIAHEKIPTLLLGSRR